MQRILTVDYNVCKGFVETSPSFDENVVSIPSSPDLVRSVGFEVDGTGPLDSI